VYLELSPLGKEKIKSGGWRFFNDPHLPKEMLPDNWWGNTLKELLKKRKIFEAKYIQ